MKGLKVKDFFQTVFSWSRQWKRNDWEIFVSLCLAKVSLSQSSHLQVCKWSSQLIPRTTKEWSLVSWVSSFWYVPTMAFHNHLTVFPTMSQLWISGNLWRLLKRAYDFGNVAMQWRQNDPQRSAMACNGISGNDLAMWWHFISFILSFFPFFASPSCLWNALSFWNTKAILGSVRIFLFRCYCLCWKNWGNCFLW